MVPARHGTKKKKRTQQTHLHPVQLRVVVRFRQTGKHEVIRVLQEGPAAAKAGGGEHRGVQGRGRLVGVRCGGMGVRRRLLLVGRRGRRGRWEVFAGLVDDAQLHDGRRVDWSSIGCSTKSERPQSMAFSTHSQQTKKKKKQFAEKQMKKKQILGRDIPPTPHILACLGCCRMQRS